MGAFKTCFINITELERKETMGIFQSTVKHYNFAHKEAVAQGRIWFTESNSIGGRTSLYKLSGS